MKWITRRGKRAGWREKARRWHRWWAWRPVKIDEVGYEPLRVPEHRVLFEYVERKLESEGLFRWWAYRTPKDD
jgi:hypothetical protein